MISVIVPVYNAENWIRRCVDSLLKQTVFNQLEIILVDDGSTDKSPEILDSYSVEYENIYVQHIKNQGVSNARNQGIDMATGDYLAFVDADDYVDHDYFELLLSGTESGADLICTGFIAEYPGKSVSKCSKKKYSLNREQTVDIFLAGDEMDPNIHNKLFARSIIGDNRLDARFIVAEDKYFLFQCIKSVKHTIILSEAKYHYVMNDSSACRSIFNAKKLCSLQVAELITEETKQWFPDYYECAKSMEADVICRVYGDIYANHVQKDFKAEYNALRKKIHRCNLVNKYRNSSKKHFFAFLAAWIHPRLYNFLKHDMKLQYK